MMSPLSPRLFFAGLVCILLLWLLFLFGKQQKNLAANCVYKEGENDRWKSVFDAAAIPGTDKLFEGVQDVSSSLVSYSDTDIYGLSPEDKEVFMSRMERKYEKRRNRIAHVCDVFKAIADKEHIRKWTQTTHMGKNSLIYDPVDGVAYCQIPKVASSTWCRQFATLANPSDKLLAMYRDALQLLGPLLWPAPRENKMDEALKNVTSMVIVRNPLSRVASVYYEKFIRHGGKGQTWHSFVQSVIGRFRKKKIRIDPSATYEFSEDDPKYASPEEFVSFLIHALTNKDQQELDPHWTPQHEFCAFCRIQYDVYAKMEELDEDSAYFVMKGKLVDKLDHHRHSNPTSSFGENKEARFWSKVSQEKIRQIYEGYKLDFLMFGYSLQDYLSSLDLS